VFEPSVLAAPFFPRVEELGRFQPTTADSLSEDYQSLLDHDDHMTVTVEAFYDTLVDVRVLREHRENEHYSRVSLLARRDTGQVVQLGIMRINLHGLPEKVRTGIEERRAPLGRILIRHHILRRVELCQLWQIEPGPVLQEHLGVSGDQSIFGRTARIIVEGRPAVELLEIVKL
jgi:chorismate-pyruvate lyase